MLPPIDYPQDRDKRESTQTDITYGALLDRAAAEKPITDEMIRAACLKMEAAQQFPFASKDDASEPTLKHILTKLRSVNIE